MAERDQGAHRSALWVALLTAACLAAWSPAVHPGYVGWDTPWLVVDNPLLNGGDWRNLPTIWTDLSVGTRLTLGAEYLPVRDTTVLLDFLLAGDSWAVHHAHSLAWYLLGCGLFGLVAVRLLGCDHRGALATAVFALHPLHVESVVWLGNRKDVVSLALFFASMWLWMNRGPRRWAGPAAVAVGLLAYWSKNTAIVLPAVLVLLSLLHERQDPRKPRWWAQWLPWGLVMGAGLALTMRTGRQVAMFAERRGDTLLETLLIQLQVVQHDLAMTIWPVGLSAVYPEPTATGLLEPPVITAVVTVGLAAAVMAVTLRRRPTVGLGLAWFAVTLLPVSQIVPIQNLIADRYLLLPSAGAAIALAGALPARLPRRALVAVTCALSLALGLATWERSQVWHSTEALWRSVTETHPELPAPWAALAGQLVDDGRHDAASRALEEGLKWTPGAPALLQGRGAARLRTGDPTGAEADLRAALEADPDLQKARNNLAILLHRTGRSDAALAEAATLTSRRPLYPEGWNTLGAIAIDLGRGPAAVDALGQAIALRPYSVDTMVNLGNAHYLAGDLSAAAEWWGRAVSYEPDHPAANAGLRHLRSRGAAP